MSRRFFAAHRSPSWLVALAGLLAVALVAPAHGGERRNIHGMHTLMDGGAFVSEGMNWTRHLVGEGGYVFDWVRGDHGKWVVEAMDRGLIPCLRIQECNGGCIPSPGYPAIVVSVIREHLAEHRPQYQNRLIYVQLWNEPGDPRDFVTPEDFADYLVQAHHAVKQADIEGVFRTMTPGQTGSEWWRRAIRHNPAVCQAFDVWASHPYPESYPPHYNHHDGVPYINQVKTIDSYLPDLDAVADECQKQGSPRRGFPVMITETVYGDHLGIAYEGYPKTTRGAACTTDGPCDFKMAAEYNVAAFTEFWHKWPEIIAVHPFILNNWSWDYFAFVSRMSGSRNDGAVPSWCPTEDVAGGVPWPPGYSEGAQHCGLPTAPYPQYRALLDLPKSPPASLEPFRGPVGSIRGFVRRADTGDPVAHATVSTDGYEFGGPSLFDGQYVVRNVPIGSYTLRAEKVGHGATSVPVTVEDGVEAVVDFDLVYRGKVSKGLYFQNQGTCNGCNLFAPFLGQTLQVPPDVGFIKFAAAMPNVGNLTVKLSILEGGPTGPQLGPSTTAFLEWGGEMIGAEWPGDGVPVTPGSQIFLKVERADGQGLYCYGTDSDPYPDGMAYTGTTAHPGWDLFATVRGLTVAVDTALGTLSGRVEDVLGAPVGGAKIRTAPGSHTTLTGSDGRYVFAALAEGTYDVTASRGGFLPQTRSGVTVLEGQTTSVDFSLTEDVSLGTLAGGVSDDAGILLVGAAVLVSPGGHARTTDANGLFAVDDLAAGSYAVQVSLAGFETHDESGIVVDAGATTQVDIVLTSLPGPMPGASLIVNGDFSQGREGWSVWVERGALSPVVNAVGQLHMTAVGHNGGVYQSFSTGGAGSEIAIDGFWASGPTVGQAQWAEVLVINGPRQPVDGQDVSAGQPDVVLVYKNDTWASPGGWSGAMDGTSPAGSAGGFVAAGDTATIILKSGNLLGVSSGTLYDDVSVTGSVTPPPVNGPPVAAASAQPTSGTIPLTVSFDGSASSDPDGDPLSYSWDFGDGAQGTGATVSHNYTGAAAFTVTLTVDDGRGGTDSTSLTIMAEAAPPPPPTSLIVNGDFSQGLEGWSVWVERGALSPTVNGSGQLQLAAVGHNGGVYQTFSTGGVGREVAIDGFWASGPTAPQAQWAEVLVINGARLPAGGQDVSAGQSDVVLVYKNDTWASPDGWSGAMDQTSPVGGAGRFVATGETATIVLKSGNVLGASSGTLYDDISVTESAAPPPVPPPSPGPEGWDPRLDELGLTVITADVPEASWYWALIGGVFESDGEILPPPGGGSESSGTHSIYVKALSSDGSPVEGQEATVSWPRESPTEHVAIQTKAAIDGFWGDFPMAGGSWCPFFPDGPRGPYGARMAGAPSDQVWGMGMPCNRHVSFRFTWRWTQKAPTAAKSKLTIHGGFGGPLSMQFVERAKPRLVKILDSFSAAPEIKRLSPGTVIIGRAYLATQPMDGDPVQRAREWWDRSRAIVLQYPEIDYWEAYNEPIIQTSDLMSWYAAFEAERVRLLAEHGRRACIGNFSTGNPDLPLWADFFPAIDAARAAGGILGVHEYGTPMQQFFDEAAGEGWLCGRYRKLYRQYLIPNDKGIPLAITETGVDVVPPVGWKNHFTEDEYLQQLEWYDRLLLQDDYVLGATIFALEIPGWWSFDIAPIVDRLADYVAEPVGLSAP